jgi:hypothetical protein
MANRFKSYAQDHGGRVSLLLLLFLLAIYEFVTMGFNAFAIVCLAPIIVLVVIATFRRSMLAFWALIFVNYLIQAKWLSLPVPTSVPNELLQLLLIALALIDVQNSPFRRAGNIMLFALLLWAGLCTLEVLNDTCGLGIDVAAWYSTARMICYQLLYIFLVFTVYINSPQVLSKYLLIWAGLALFASFWVWKQVNFGFTPDENAWLQTRGRSTHIIAGGTLIRYFSIYSDAANFGIGIASTAVAFIIFGITSRIKKHKIFFLCTGVACIYAMFQSGTRTAIACLMAGFMLYIVLSKSFKIAIPFTAFFVLFVLMLAFTTIGNSNQQIRRMRSAFDKNDASAAQRSVNQEAMKKYLAEAPWGIGMGIGYGNAPANNKYTFMATVPPDSEYVFIWIHTGIIGITVFIISMFLMLFGACWIVFFKLRSPSLRGIGAGFCCAFASQQLGGYGNQVLLQFPNCLVFFGGLAIVYVLPYLEDDWIKYEEEQLAIEAEKKRLKLEKKAKKVKNF